MIRVWIGYGTGMDRGMERDGPSFPNFLAAGFAASFYPKATIRIHLTDKNLYLTALKQAKR